MREDDDLKRATELSLQGLKQHQGNILVLVENKLSDDPYLSRCLTLYTKAKDPKQVFNYYFSPNRV